jgi:hypothetical protein
MGVGVRMDRGGALPTGERQGAPGPGRGGDDDAMSPHIRKLILGWGGDLEQREEGPATYHLRLGVGSAQRGDRGGELLGGVSE